MKTNKVLLVVLFCIALAMRFYNFAEVPLSHDEFSALFRLHYNSFLELIEFGVMTDGHPAAVQVFLYYWTALVGGSTPWLIKLPFTLLGVASLYAVYKTTAIWFSDTTALLVLAFLVCSPFHIYYSQIARPYIVGFAFFWTMNWMLSRYLNHIGKPNTNLIYFVVFAFLACSSHYLSLLSVVFSVILALALASKTQVKSLFLASLSIPILYLAQLPIFIKQLGVGGVFWLSIPEPDFFVDFLFYTHNFSWITVCIILIIISLSFVWKNKNQSILSLILAFSLIALPYLVSYFYSVFRTPILQYSLLFFAFPFLLMFGFGRFRNLSSRKTTILVSGLIIGVAGSAIFSRNYYHHYYQNLYQNLWQGSIDLEKTYPNKSMVSFIKNHKTYSNYYTAPSDFVDLNAVRHPHEFAKKVSSYLDKDMLYLAGVHDLDPTYVQIAQYNFPFLIEKHDYFGGSRYLFSKTELPSTCGTQSILLADLESDDLDISTELWSPPYLKSHAHSSLERAFVVDSNTLKSITFHRSFSASVLEKNTILDIQADLSQLTDCDDVELIFSIKNSTETLLWQSKNINTLRNSDSDEQTTLFFSYFFSEELFKSYSDKEHLEFYFLNPTSGQFKINRLKVSVRQGNPVIYGINEAY
ncbi:MAG: glycosyltransferase family 39 protein [Flavobacteriales bacterium]